MLVLALVWWAWSAFVWAANAQDTGAPTLRLVLLLAMVLTFVAGLALPHAYGDDAPAVRRRLRRRALPPPRAVRRRLAARQRVVGGDRGLRRSRSLIGMALLVAGAIVGGTAQVVLWTARRGDRLRRPRLADPRAPARPPARRGRALRRALQPLHHHLPRRVDRRDRRRGERGGVRRAARRGRDARPAHHGRAVVDVLRPLRRGRRGAAARPITTRCSRPPTPTATCTSCSSPGSSCSPSA